MPPLDDVPPADSTSPPDDAPPPDGTTPVDSTPAEAQPASSPFRPAFSDSAFTQSHPAAAPALEEVAAPRPAPTTMAGDTSQLPRGAFLAPPRPAGGFLSWLPNLLKQDGLLGALGLASIPAGDGLPRVPTNPVPGGGCPPAGACMSSPSPTQGSRQFGLAVFFTVAGPELTVPTLVAPSPTAHLELPPATLLERPG